MSFILTLTNVHAEESTRNADIVAKVNGAEISEKELEIAVTRYLPRDSFHSGVSSEQVKEAEKKALEELINRELFYQEAIRQGITPDMDEIERRLSVLKQRYPSKEEFERSLTKYGMSVASIKERVKKDTVIEKLIEKEVNVIVSDEEVKDYYENNNDKFLEPESLHMRYILVKFRPSEPDFRERAKAKIEEALKKIKSGTEFAEVAWSYSDDGSRVKGGDIGYIHRGMLPEDIERAAFSMKEGELSDIIENDYGYHIIQVLDKRPERQIAFEEIKDKLKQTLTDSYQRERKERLIQRLREKAEIIYID
jgi:peptidyl-prolyl cis-trans isomerase C